METPIWQAEDVQDWLRNQNACPCPALALYRSDWGAIVTDPGLMSVPVDDHLVHRGDGVFETLLCEAGAVYNLDAHVKRLRTSAAAIHLEVPWTDPELRNIILDTFRASEAPRSLGRVLAGRGPGGFSVDPEESTGPSLYVVVYPSKPPFMESHPEGAKLITSRIPPKSGGLAPVKTCNYIPNALAKREATLAGADFALGVDAEGFLTESATENLATIPGPGVINIAPATHHLAGTTLTRVAEMMQGEGWTVTEEPIRPDQLFEMDEVWIVGTTAYVTMAVMFDGKPLFAGPHALDWMDRLQEDIQTNPALRDRV